MKNKERIMTPYLKPKKVDIDSSHCRFGAEALVRLIQTIETQINGVEKNEDIEYVHKMRVTSRRIRATIPLFKDCFTKKSYKEWRNEIKKVTQFLGDARDLDVQIEFIKDYIKLLEPTEPKKGIEDLLQGNIEQRTHLQSNVKNGLLKLKKSKVLEEINSCCEQMIIESAGNLFNLSSVREKAFWQISSKLDDLLAMEKYVNLENEILRHHETRIRAKWLRYTMECYAPLYPDEFSGEIAMMENFQDLLGEMHDCDVWIERISKLINEIESENIMLPEKQQSAIEEKQSLLKFLAYIEEKRKNRYEKFVIFWNTEKSKNSFEELRRKASAGFAAAGYRMKAELENPYVRIAVIADINSNLNALKAVIQDAESRGITVFLNAGDTLGFGAYPNEVVQTLYSKNALSIKGNFDLEVLQAKKNRKGPKKFALGFVEKTLKKSFKTYLVTFPSKLELEIAHKKAVIINGYNLNEDNKNGSETLDNKLRESAQDLKAEIVIIGNPNEQFTKKAEGALFINPGSVGRSRGGKNQAAYATISANPFSVELLKVNYDKEAAADALRKIGAPESYAQSLLRGQSIEETIQEDKERMNDMEINCASITRTCADVASKYWPDMKHSEQVRKISLDLFDALKDLHKLGNREYCWLECAAILHDIGLSKGSNGHHKNTLRLILNETQLPFTSTERQAIANISRYHRKDLPKNNHEYFGPLSREAKKKVIMLSSILRLADSLDFSHQSNVQSIETIVNLNNVTVHATFNRHPILEEQEFIKKKDLFEKVFTKKIMLAWKNSPGADYINGQSKDVSCTTKNESVGQQSLK